MTTPKPSADRMTIDALRGVLRQIAAKAHIAREGGLSVDPRWALERIEDEARRALAATEERTTLNATVERASERVEEWPEWKQNITFARRRKPKALGSRTREDVLAWIAGYNSLERKSCDEAGWIALKLSCTRDQAQSIMAWLAATEEKCSTK